MGCSEGEKKTVLWGLDLSAAETRGGVRLSPGHFEMGSPPREPGRFDTEVLHPVTLQKSLILASTEVTQAQYEAVMGTNPSKTSTCGPDCPVDRVTWMEAVEFCNRLSIWEGVAPAYTIGGQEVAWDGKSPGYRLPTEAEWEYAARAGLKHVYAGSNEPGEVSWYGENSKGMSHPVGRRKPNHWGFYDMSGNVREWVWDRWGVVFPPGESVDPRGPETGDQRVNRGGSWSSDARRVRAAYRRPGEPGERSVYIGFRVARTVFAGE
jgi:formylglycine-generating enzyme required for sulfatase activity